jgi:hypothetical protein
MMKRIVFSILFSLFVVSSAFAQLSIGPKIGYTASKLSFDENDISSSFSSSFQYGVFARIGEEWFIQPEIMVTQKGSVLTHNSREYNGRHNTIDFAALFGIYLLDLKVAKLNFQAGPVASIITDKGILSIPDEVENAELNDAVWAMQFGLGVDVLMFTLDVRYELGMSSVYSGDFNAKNSLFQVTLGWKLFSF